MIQIGDYLKFILIKKKITQQELVNRLNLQKIPYKNGYFGKITKNKASVWVNNNENISLAIARRIEIALELPRNTLLNYVKTKNSSDEIDMYNAVEKWYKEEYLKEE